MAPILLAADSPESGERPNQLLSGCVLGKLNFDPYPFDGKRRGLSGRVLAVVERTPEGRARVVRIAVSNPPDFFDASVRRLFDKFKCEPLEVAKQGYVSITFSIDPGPDFPHFDGADEELDVRGERIPPDARQGGVTSPGAALHVSLKWSQS